MAGNKSLEGLLKWSLSHSDGTAPPRQITEEERRWFSEAVAGRTVDIVKRMKEITAVISAPEDDLLQQGVTVDDLAGVLEELQEHVESLDMANDLKPIGGLQPLLRYLKSSHAILRSRAAEVVSTMVQNNPPSQKNVMEAGGLLLLVDNFLSDDDVVSRTKALGAISSLIRHNPEGLSTFRSVCGTKGLISGLRQQDVKLLRKNLQVLQYLLEENPEDVASSELPELINVLSGHVSDGDDDMRLATLQLLSTVAPIVGKQGAHQDGSPKASLDESRSNLKVVLSKRMEALGKLEGVEAEEKADEKSSLQSVWAAFFMVHRARQSPRASGVSLVQGDRNQSEKTLFLGPPS